MRRREFVTLLGSAAVAWPLLARAQQSGATRRIGVLIPVPASDPESLTRLAALLQGLQEFGWAVGRNVRIDYRFTEGDPERIRRGAAELVALAPDVIFTEGHSTMGPFLQATRTVPIVFTIVIDPVGSGFVASLARPGGNATGFTLFEFSLSGKWLELLKEIAPRVTRVAVLRDPAEPAGIGQWGAIQGAASSLAMDLTPVNVRDVPEMERAVGAFAHSGNGGLILTGARWREYIAIGSSRWRRAIGCPRSTTPATSSPRRPDLLWA